MNLRRAPQGFSLLELLVVVAIAGVLVTLVVPPLLELSARLRLHIAAVEVATTLRYARSQAIRVSANVGLKFHVRGEIVHYATYVDGDGDGVRTADIRRGVDPALGPLRRLTHTGGRIDFGIPETLRPREIGSRRRLDRLQDPIRFNRSDIAAFSPLGLATPGTLYLTDGHRLAAVRVFNRTGKVTVHHYDRERERWR